MLERLLMCIPSYRAAQQEIRRLRHEVANLQQVLMFTNRDSK